VSFPQSGFQFFVLKACGYFRGPSELLDEEVLRNALKLWSKQLNLILQLLRRTLVLFQNSSNKDA
jgi:hypothetical protein